MAPGASVKALLLAALLAGLAPPAGADPRKDEEARRLKRVQAELQQLFFGKAIVAEARRHIGKPYVWGGKDGQPGFDCSGYTSAVFAALGVTLPAGAQAQLQAGAAVPQAGLKPGDLCFFVGRGSPFHVGIYEGDGRFLHAPGTGKRIRAERLAGAYAHRRWIGARRLLPPESYRARTEGPKKQATTTQEKRP
jgi:cell wall-associated NlpC family hydrolase